MTRIKFWRIIVMMVIIVVVLDEMTGDREKKRKIKELFAHKAEKFQRIGYRIVAVAFVIWTIWHLAMLYGMVKEPIRITQRPLGYDQASGDGEIWAASYVKLKNISYREVPIQLRLYEEDTEERRQEFQLRSIEIWGREEDGKETRIGEDLTVTVPPRTEIGLYIRAVRKEQEDIFFPVHTEQEIQIIYCGKEGERMVDAAKERVSLYEKGVCICRTYTPCSDRTGY